MLVECPFCGKADRLVGPEYSDYEDCASFWIECERCEIVMERPTKSRVVKDWNTRTPVAEQRLSHIKPMEVCMFFRDLSETMVDSDVPKLFERATGRKYTELETCVNDIRRLCAQFWNEELARRLKHRITENNRN